MSVAFYNERGFVIGVDFHPGCLPAAAATRGFCLVSAPFGQLACTAGKKIQGVTFDSHPSIQAGFDLYLVAHCPSDLRVDLCSGSKAVMNVHKVTIKKEKAAVCLESCVGLNMDCNEPVDLPTGGVINPNSVVTQPTTGDYVGSLANAALDSAISWGLGKAAKGAGELAKRFGEVGEMFVEDFMKHVFRRGPDALPKSWLKDHTFDAPSTLNEWVQQWADGEITFSSWLDSSTDGAKK